MVRLRAAKLSSEKGDDVALKKYVDTNWIQKENLITNYEDLSI